MQALLRNRRAVAARRRRRRKSRIGAVGERTAGEQRLDADHRRRSASPAASSLRSTARPPGSAMRTAICASSGCVLGRQLVEIDGEARLAGGIGRRQIFQRLLDAARSPRRRGRTDNRQSRPLLGDGRPSRRLRDRARRPARHRGNARRPRLSPGLCEMLAARRGQVELDAVGHIILDQKRSSRRPPAASDR